LEKENAPQLDNIEIKSSISDNNDIVQDQISEDKHDTADVEIIKARERTFNKELSDLVLRIRSNEPQEKTETESRKEITEDELLRMYHRLYYKAVNLEGRDRINSDLNPFDLYRESSSDDLLSLINKEIVSLDLPEYAILIYDVDKKCYVNYSNHIIDFNENNIIIDPQEGLYSKIADSNNGVVLDQQSIERNSYLNKRFGFKKSVYLVSFSSFFRDFYKEANLDKKMDFSDHLSPVLLIQLKENITEHQKNSFYNKIKNKLSIYFFLLYKKLIIENLKLNLPNQYSLFNFIDYTYRKYSRYEEYLCCIIKLRNYINSEFLYVLKYLESKLAKKLTEKTTISRIEKDKLVIFTKKSRKKILDDIIDDFNKVHGNILNVRMFMNDENRKSINLLMTIKEEILK
jgi:hypothetical protein